MGRIKNEFLYIIDSPASKFDKVIGSDAEASGRTKNYLLGELYALFTQLSGGGVFSYTYTASLTDLDTISGLVATNDSNTNPNSVNLFRFSRIDLFSRDLKTLVENYNNNQDGVVLKVISEDDPNLITAYTITGITVDTNWVEISVLRHKNLNTLTFEVGKNFNLSFDLVNLDGFGGGGGATNTSQLVNDGEDGINPFISVEADTLDSVTTRGSITANGITVGSLQLAGGIGTQGTMSWNTDEETVDIIQNGTTLQVGQGIQYHVRNNTGLTIADGVAVMATGTLGNSGRITVAPMNNNGTFKPEVFIGITTEEIPAGEDGKVAHFGKIRGLNTTGVPVGEVWADGDFIYLSTTTPGALTKVQPIAISGTTYKSPIAIVIKAHSNGTLLIRIQGNEGIHELHDVEITSIADKDVIRWSTANNRFENYTSNNWDTAFGWGDHSSAGYLTSFSETDPVFIASPAGGITADNITQWNTAFGWGNHALAGYLTSFSEADTLQTVTARGNTSNIYSVFTNGFDVLGDFGVDGVSTFTNTDSLPTPFYSEDFSVSLGDFTTSGDALWTRVTDEGNGDLFSARSGAIGDYEVSTLQLIKTTTVEYTTLEFDYKTSTEEGFDYLIVNIDGVDVAKYGGTNAWTTKRVYLHGIGSHTITWRYWRDHLDSGGTDQCWIDNVSLHNVGEAVQVNGSMVVDEEIYVRGRGVFEDGLSSFGDIHYNGRIHGYRPNGQLGTRARVRDAEASFLLFSSDGRDGINLVTGDTNNYIRVQRPLSTTKEFDFSTGDGTAPYLFLENPAVSVHFGEVYSPSIYTLTVNGHTKLKNTLTVDVIDNALSDTDKFLVSDGGVVKFRTGTQVLSDIGGEPLTEMLSTGLTQGGAISINGVDPSKFDISAGSGIVVDHSTSPPTYTEVTWGAFTSQTITNLATQFNTDIAINSAGAIVQQASFSTEDVRSLIFLGGIDHNNQTTIDDTFSVTIPTKAVGLSLRDLARAVGDINIDGNIYSANGANLNINKSSGQVFSYGRNFLNNVNAPHQLDTALVTVAPFGYVFNDGSGSGTFTTDTTSINPNNYDDGTGVLATVGVNKYTIQRFLLFPNENKTFVQYGTTQYNRLEDALDAVPRASFVALSGIKSAMVRGYLIVRQGTVSLNNSANAVFLSADKFGVVSSLASGVAATLDSLTDTTITSNTAGEILKWNGSAWVNNTLAEAGIMPSTQQLAVTKALIANEFFNSYDSSTGLFTSAQVAYSGLSGIPSTFAPSAHTLDSHSNVTITANSAGEILKWNGSAWVNNTLAEAGIAPTISFGTDNQIPYMNLAGTDFEYSSALNFNSSLNAFSIGVNDTDSGRLYLYGNGASELPLGGGVFLFASADFDTVNESYGIYPWEDNLRIVDGNESPLLEYFLTADAWYFYKAVETASTLTIATINAAVTDTDKFLVSDAGVVKFRTGAELLSDIGASSSSHNHTLDSLSNVTITANSSGELLKWNGSAWINNTLAEAGISAVGHTHTFSSLTSIPTTIAGYGITDFNSLGDARWLGISDTAANSTLLDSIDSTQFLRSDVADIKTAGDLVFNDNIKISFGTLAGESSLYSNATNTYFDLTSGDLLVRDSTTTRFTFGRTTGDFTATGGLFTASNSVIGRTTTLAIEATATHFASTTPRFEVQTGTAAGTYQEGMVLRHQGSDATAVTRRLGFLMKLSSEASSGESDKMGGMVLDSANIFANSPDLHFLTANDKRMTIQYGGNVGIGNTSPSYKLDVTGTGRFTGDHTANDHINTSDIRLKSDIRDLKTNVSVHDVNLKSYVKNGRIEWGVIAQELREVLPHAVIGDEDKEMLAVSYNQLLMLAIKEIQSQDDRLKIIEQKLGL